MVEARVRRLWLSRRTREGLVGHRGAASRAGRQADFLCSASTTLSRSDSVVPPQTPYGSPTESACCRHSGWTGQVPHSDLATISRARLRTPRSDSGEKKSSGLTSRQAACDCQSHRSMSGRGRRGIPLDMATSLTHRERGRALGENYAQLTPSSTLVVSNFGPFVIAACRCGTPSGNFRRKAPSVTHIL